METADGRFSGRIAEIHLKFWGAVEISLDARFSGRIAEIHLKFFFGGGAVEFLLDLEFWFENEKLNDGLCPSVWLNQI